ncbi:MAG: hypothetical protein FWE00_01785 [Defluviitaleaceae bacterium]|nr:hypothetical protein [Defluviitaleaceae bacterium]
MIKTASEIDRLIPKGSKNSSDKGLAIDDPAITKGIIAGDSPSSEIQIYLPNGIFTAP